MIGSHLELRVLRTAQNDRPAALDLGGRNEPATSIFSEHEKEVAARGVEGLDDSVPALVAAQGRELDTEAAAVAPGAGLDLNPDQSSADLSDQVVVRTVKQGKGDVGADLGQPMDRCRLAEVALSPWILLP